jgi:hypothetical protein
MELKADNILLMLVTISFLTNSRLVCCLKCKIWNIQNYNFPVIFLWV